MTSRISFSDYSDSTSVLQSSDVLQPPASSLPLYMKCFRFEGSLRTSYLRTILEKARKGKNSSWIHFDDHLSLFATEYFWSKLLPANLTSNKGQRPEFYVPFEHSTTIKVNLESSFASSVRPHSAAFYYHFNSRKDKRQMENDSGLTRLSCFRVKFHGNFFPPKLLSIRFLFSKNNLNVNETRHVVVAEG